MRPEEAAGWLGLGGVYGLDLRSLGKLHRLWPSWVEARARLMEGGAVLDGVVRPSFRGRVSGSAAAVDVRGVLDGLAASGASLVATHGSRLGERLERDALWPPVVSTRGEFPPGPCVAMVGMRKASQLGRRFAFELAKSLAREGVAVVSGLAFGIDCAAHEGTLAGGGRAVAVLAGGVANVSPRANAWLAEKIVASGGAVVSHVPPLAESPGWRFPVRNRLIAGLSDAVVVVEAAASGGSLSTAKHAASLGRPLYAVPGFPWATTSVGTNALVADGALMCRGLDDLRPALGIEAAKHRGTAPPPDASAELPPLDASVLAKLEWVELPIEQVVMDCRLPTIDVLAALSRLEVAGLVTCPSPTSVARVGPPRSAGEP